MGIRGLTTFFNNNPSLSKSHKLHDTSVIIDGNNLIHLLYFSSKVDCVYGGDYYKYANTVKKYFLSYLECNIKPIVVFDGGYDKSDRKFQTILLRSKTRLSLTQHIAKYGECAGNILPINAKEVFRNVLLEMCIPYAQCDFEADDQITALANYYNCPVLSDDSDFYIFDVHQGFIRLSSVDSNVLESSGANADFKFLDCEIYHIDKFLSYFPGINRNVLPLFATLVGNDYANTKDFRNFFSNIQLPKIKGKNLRVNQSQKKIVGLLSWLSNCNLDEAIQQVLSFIKKNRRDRLKSVIERSVTGYQTEKCSLTYVIEGNLVGLKKLLEEDTKLETLCGQSLPIEFAISFHSSNLPSFFLNIINLHRTFLPAQVENTSWESSYVCSRYIRQIIYGILLQHSFTNVQLHEKQCIENIKEYDRRYGGLQCELVPPLFALKNGNALPKLDDIFNMNKSESQKFLSYIMEIELCYLSAIPESLQLLFGCITYWLKHSSPLPRDDIVYSVVLNIIYFHVILNKHAVLNDDPESCHNSDSLDISSITASISLSSVQLASQSMKKYLQKPVLNKGNPLFLYIIHGFSQLQTCILYISYLNALLSYPFKYIKLHETLSGTMIYNLTKDLSSRPYPDLFVSELLGRQSNLSLLFTVLKNKVFDCVPAECVAHFDRSQLIKSKKNARKKKLQDVLKQESLPQSKVKCDSVEAELLDM